MADITSNLVLHWKFNDGSGSSAADSSGNSSTGTLNNSPSWGSGQFGQSCLTFNGSNSNVSRATYTAPTTGTLAFWFNPSRAYNSGVTENLFNIGGTSLLHGQHWNTNHLFIGFYQSSGAGDYRLDLTLDASMWAQNTWQQYCLTWVSGGTTTLYRNNTAIGTPKNGVNTTLAAGTWRVAANDTGAAGFSGSIQDVRIYSRVLSSDDLAALYAYTGIIVGAKMEFSPKLDFGYGF